MSDLDPIIHAPARLRVMATLAALDDGDELAFPKLQRLLTMTAGNLSTHLRRLEEARYLQQTKTYTGRTPVTYLKITARGRSALQDYTDTLTSLLQGVQE